MKYDPLLTLTDFACFHTRNCTWVHPSITVYGYTLSSPAQHHVRGFRKQFGKVICLDGCVFVLVRSSRVLYALLSAARLVASTALCAPALALSTPCLALSAARSLLSPALLAFSFTLSLALSAFFFSLAFMLSLVSLGVAK